ncbi:uncharacterized protein LOC123320222 [Coccinella septempunctata]|uniref:uncharacterized protein LOC123320222 n=1 Tax=Coccinella septempunctata TaxID=41139 RepID=UPI001D07C318|nr:uncharacterized protein LOC123320222 [Coccinella septempunctata]
MESEPPDKKFDMKRERNFPNLDLSTQLNTSTQPILVVQSPKTPTLSRKLKAVSLDSEPQKENSTSLELSRDVFSMPNTPKKQIKSKLLSEFNDEANKLTPCFPSNLKKFASNTSISGSQTLKTLPEIMTLQDFSDNQNSKAEPVKFKPKGLLERRGSNASLTIDLGSNPSISEPKVQPLMRLNTARSVSNLNLTTFGTSEKCPCLKRFENGKKTGERRKSQETCGNCIIYESVPSKVDGCKSKCQIPIKRCVCTASKCRRKSLSNENLYVPPCGFCQNGSFKECIGTSKNCKGYRKAFYPRQPDIEDNQLLSEDFKNHLQNMQYLQTAGCVLSIQDLKEACEESRVPKLHQEFWEVPLNLQEKCYVSGSQSRNRYKGVLPNEHSRVHLPGVQTYIHANYIKGPDYTETAYIATQGPMAHTCQDFWSMIWHTNCQIIVMLTGLVEKGKNKCELYFPIGKRTDSPDSNKFLVKTFKVREKFTFDSKHNFQEFEEEMVEFEALDEVTFGNFKIKYLSEENFLQDCPLRYLELTRLVDGREPVEEKRVIKHYWFTNWQDHKMADPRLVLNVALDVLDNIPAEKSKESKLETRVTSNVVRKKDLFNNHEGIREDEEPSEVKKETAKGPMWSSFENSRNPFSYSFSNAEKSRSMENSSGSDTNDNPFDIRLRRTPRMVKNQRFGLAKSEESRKKVGEARQVDQWGRTVGKRKETGGLLRKDKKTEEAQKGPSKAVNGVIPNSPKESSKGTHCQRRPSSDNVKVPLVVHCSAGIGRTGCFLAILNGIQQLKNGLNVDVLAILCSLRLNRGGMVQTAEQYELIHRVLNLFAEVM